MTSEWKKAEQTLKQGGIAIVPTDTVYGFIAPALDKKAVERVYKVRGRNPKKPCIILVSSYRDIEKLGITITDENKKILEQFWPGKVSVILPCLQEKFTYLHRGTKSLAIRMIGPKHKNLLHLIKAIGPLIAPSANPEGMPTARNRKESRRYFGKDVDAYVCSGTRDGLPSTLVKLKNGKLEVLRQGSIAI